ncbi:MAG: aminotransferase class V-fold PLP-dependent enzyme, partial [Hominenteromicrobium sp.]
DGIDYLCCAGHKGLYGTMGTGMLITKQGGKLRSLIQGGTGTLALQLEQPRDMPEYLESGTQNVPGILALGAGIDFVRNQGEDNLRRRELHHVRRIYEAFSRLPEIELYTPLPDMRYSAPVLGFNVRGMQSEAVGEVLAKRGIAVRCGFHCAPFAHRKMGTDDDIHGGAVRVSPGAFTTDAQTSELIRTVTALHAKRSA